MPTECIPTLFEFPAVEGRQVVAGFDGGAITTDAGALLLGQTDRAIRLTERFAACFTETRTAGLVEHQVETLVMQGADHNGFGNALDNVILGTATADVIIGGLDNRECRLHVNRQAWRFGKPWAPSPPTTSPCSPPNTGPSPTERRTSSSRSPGGSVLRSESSGRCNVRAAVLTGDHTFEVATWFS